MNAYLLAMIVGALASTDPPHTARFEPPDGKVVYDQSCRKCHGARGVPSQAMTKMMQKLPVLDSAFMSKLSTAAVEDALKNGKGKMQPFGEKLSAAEIAAVTRYVFELANATPLSTKAAK